MIVHAGATDTGHGRVGVALIIELCHHNNHNYAPYISQFVRLIHE